MSSLIVITGASAGLGRALLAAAPSGSGGGEGRSGSHRVDVSRSGPPPEADEHVAADLAEPTDWDRVGDELDRLVASRPWDRITLIHCAGTLQPIGFAGEVDGPAYRRNVLLNSAAGQVLGHRFLAAVGELTVRRELALVSSGAARSAYAGWSAYGAGKAACDQWVRAVGEEQGRRHGVQVLAVAPGVVATGMQEAIRDTDERDFPNVERFRDLHRDGDLIEPGDAARRFWSVLDDDAVVTGAVVDLRDR